MIYSIRLSDRVKDDLARLAKSEPKAFAKAGKFIEELRVHPKTGTGHPEPLKGLPEGRWSRQITKKHRLIYQIRYMLMCLPHTVTMMINKNNESHVS